MAIHLGKHNPRLAEVRSALRTGSLTPDGLLAVEGLQLVTEAARSGLPIREAFCDTTVPPDLPPAEQLYLVDSRAFRAVHSTETSPGVIALVRPNDVTLDAVLGAPNGIWIVLCRLQDPGNVGTIIRSAEAFGATACLALQGTVSIYNAKVVRAAAGSVFRVPHVWSLDADSLFGRLRSRDITVVGTSPRGTEELDAVDWEEPCAVLIGNEGQGLQPNETLACRYMIRIPHDKRVESLNSAVVSSIVLYEAWKQRT